jgi:hypothetical protein
VPSPLSAGCWKSSKCLICLLCLCFEPSCLVWLRERCVLRAEICCFFVLLGYPGHCDKGRSQNLIAMCMAAQQQSHLQCLGGTTHRSSFSLDAASISTCRRQRLTIDAGHTDKHRRPRMALLSGCWHPVEWANALLGTSSPLRTCRSLSAVGVSRPGRRPSSHCSCKTLRVSILSLWHAACCDCVLLEHSSFKQAGTTPRGHQAA